MNKQSANPGASDRGAVLLLSLVFILMLALIAGMVIQAAILQLHMAGNDRFLEEAIHKAQAIATELSLAPKNFSLEGGIGQINCPADAQALNCDLRTLKVPRSAQASQGVEVDYQVTRVEPLMWESFPIRESQENASSSTSFGAESFEINVRIDGRESRLGKANIVQGIAVRVPVLR
jgi:hypothetical protein